MPISFYIISLMDVHPPTIKKKSKCIPLSEISLMNEQVKHKWDEHDMQSITYIIEEKKLKFKKTKKDISILMNP